MATQPLVTGALLAGGASRRMGRDKRLIEIDGEPMARRAARALAAGSAELLVVAAPGRDLPPGIIDGLGARIVQDRRADAGPLAGLEAALDAAHHELVVVAAADMPWIRPALVRGLVVALADASLEVDGVAVATRRGLEPLLACYRRSLLSTVTRLLDGGERRVTVLLDEARIGPMPEAVWRRLDPSGESVRNVNAPSDLPTGVQGA
jgi:molybdopterin-guanine dinucleotide biosynthesis protein A